MRSEARSRLEAKEKERTQMRRMACLKMGTRLLPDDMPMRSVVMHPEQHYMRRIHIDEAYAMLCYRLSDS
jgi:hypothetical protein